MRLSIALLVSFICVTTIAGTELYEFTDADDAARFKQLTQELRCMVCQNESLDGSQSTLAQDLKTRLAVLIRENYSDKDIREQMVARYGDYILYKPRFSSQSFLLWASPLVLFGVAIWRIRRFFVRGER